VEEKYYTYSQCPFTLSKFSLYQLSHQEQYDHDHDYSITANISTSSKDQKNTTRRRISGLNIMKRAREALDFSMHHNSYHRVQQALEQQAFDNRTIYLEGDSLTRQLFISLGCLAWQAGYVKYYYLGKVHVITKKKNEILANANFDGVDKFFYSASIGLRGGGKIYYHPKLGSREKLMSEAKLLVDQACDRTLNMSPKLEVPFQGGAAGSNKNTNKTMIQLGPNDVYLISGGHHMDTRDIMLESYQKALDCFLLVVVPKRTRARRRPVRKKHTQIPQLLLLLVIAPMVQSNMGPLLKSGHNHGFIKQVLSQCSGQKVTSERTTSSSRVSTTMLLCWYSTRIITMEKIH
jgi:hypothetical protein